MKRSWYHTGTDSIDDPRIYSYDAVEVEALGYVERSALNGPFDTFAAAKQDLVAVLRGQVDAWKDALASAREIRKEDLDEIQS